jgi:hypothetical protein
VDRASRPIPTGPRRRSPEVVRPSRTGDRGRESPERYARNATGLTPSSLAQILLARKASRTRKEAVTTRPKKAWSRRRHLMHRD